ncbi:hypothetical protein ACWC9T_29080 [Kitasatospora sp. NPDC001159]
MRQPAVCASLVLSESIEGKKPVGLPLFAGHVLVRLHDGAPELAEALLNALEVSFPTHTGRGQTHPCNVWEDPPTMTPEGTRTAVVSGPTSSWVAPGNGPAVIFSQAFDIIGKHVGPNPAPLMGGITADLLGTPKDVETIASVLAELFQVREEARQVQGPHILARLRLEPRTE